MERPHWHPGSRTIVRSTFVAAMCSPLILFPQSLAGSDGPSDSSSIEAVPEAPHTVQEHVGNSGALPRPEADPKLKLQPPLPWLGVAPPVVIDLMTPWSSGYLRMAAGHGGGISPGMFSQSPFAGSYGMWWVGQPPRASFGR